MSGFELLALGVVGFFLAIASGIAGGGGGIIMTPLLLFFGLSPAQAIATGKLGGLAMAVGSLRGMKGYRNIAKRTIVIIVLLSILAGIVSSRVIASLEGDAYNLIIAIVLIVLGCVMYVKKIGSVSKKRGRKASMFGYVALFTALLLQGVFSSGLGVLVSLALMVGLGLESIQANIAMRTTQLVLNVVIVLALIGSGLILWNVALVMSVANLAGSFIGGRIAVRKGSAFVSKSIALLAIVSGVALLFA
jgi:uncharacterized membrane protein YfcA